MQKKHKIFKPSAAAENAFARALRQVARQAGHVVEMHINEHGKLYREAEMTRKLKEYSEALGPWAERQASKMLERVAKKSKTAMKSQMTKNAREMHRQLIATVAESHVGEVAKKLMAEQVDLIKSIPVRAAERAQKLSLEAFYNGSRASEVAEELMRSGKVSESQANLIARTEVARANASINQARATAVGSTHYRWRNSHDEAVRPAHRIYKGKKIDGMVFAWSEPPTLDDGMTGHPGTFPNCRCYAEPVFED